MKAIALASDSCLSRPAKSIAYKTPGEQHAKV
jgi:hypothetical protein